MYCALKLSSYLLENAVSCVKELLSEVAADPGRRDHSALGELKGADRVCVAGRNLCGLS
jgi:hypothetical protein